MDKEPVATFCADELEKLLQALEEQRQLIIELIASGLRRHGAQVEQKHK
jgi:hypothetical protein